MIKPPGELRERPQVSIIVHLDLYMAQFGSATQRQRRSDSGTPRGDTSVSCPGRRFDALGGGNPVALAPGNVAGGTGTQSYCGMEALEMGPCSGLHVLLRELLGQVRHHRMRPS